MALSPRGSGGLAPRRGGGLVRQGEGTFFVSEEEAGEVVVHYHFPVEIEVRAAPEAIDVAAIEERVLARLLRSVRSRRG